jgi:flagellar assembly factor FliW
MKQIKTTRFGTLDVNSDHIVRFKDGMIGFIPLKDYFLVESPAMPLVLWLQSVDEPDVAFPLIEPWFFKRDYKSVLTDADKFSIQLQDGDQQKVLVVLTIPEDFEKMTVNMKAPVVINLTRGLATQTIIQDKGLELRVPAYAGFNAAIESLGNSESHDTHAESADSNSEEIHWTQVLYKEFMTPKKDPHREDTQDGVV